MLLSTVLSAMLFVPMVEPNQSEDAIKIAKAKTLAALKLAEVKEKPKKADAECFESIDEATKASLASGKPLVVWVGMQCKDCPEVRKHLNGLIHVHADSYKGNAGPGIIVPTPNGNYLFRKDLLGKDYGANDILKMLGQKPTS